MLPLSDKFKTSFKGKHNSVFPIVVISKLGTFTSNDDLVYLSQNARNFKFEGLGEKYFEDFGLDVSDISETIDVFDRSFQTSSVSVSVSNYAIRNKRFTERFNTEFTGHKCRIYYANLGMTDIRDCPIVFEGYIRNYRINNESCQFDVEDASQYLQDSNSFPKRRTQNPNAETIDNNKWLYYPIVYGENQRSRLLFSRPQINNLISKIFPDANYENSDIKILGFKNTENTLKILRDGMYLNVPHKFQEVPEDLIINGYNYSKYIDTNQYEIISQQIVLEKNISDHAFTNGMPLNIQARDQFQIDVSRPATGVRATSTDDKLNYGTATNSDGVPQKIEYQGHTNGYTVSSGGGEFAFPEPEDGSLDYAGYYENQLVSKFVRRFRFGTGLLSSRDYWDSGSFYILDKALSVSTEYEGTDTLGAYELYKSLPQDANELKKYFNLPGLKQDWSAEYIYCWVSAGEEVPYSVSAEMPDGGTGSSSYTASIYPTKGLVDGGIGPIKAKQETHPFLRFNVDTEGEGNLYSGYSPIGQNYFRVMGITLTRIAINGNDQEHNLLNESWRFLFDDPIDYDAEQQALQDFYASQFTLGENQCFQNYENPIPIAPPIAFREGYDGGDSVEIAQNTLHLGGTWTSSDGTQQSFIKQFPDGANHQGFGLMDWLKDENNSWEEPPTLRKLLFGRRIKDTEVESTGIPFGTWVYGCIPVLGYCKPKTSTLSHERDDSGGNYLYKISQDALYCYLNPLLECLGINDNNPSITNYGQDAGLTNNVVSYETHPNILAYDNDASAFFEDLYEWQGQHFEPFYNWLNQGKNLNLLIHYKAVDTPDEPSVAPFEIGWHVGTHEDFGSNFGPIYSRLYYFHKQNQIPIPSRIEYKGMEAYRGGNYVPISYTQGEKQAAKLDITFNSISGNDVVQGSNFARFILNMTADLYLNHIDQSADIDSHNVDFLVECDAFKNIEGRNNVIEAKKINATLETTGLDENTEPTVLYRFRTGHPEDQPVDESGSPIYSIGTLATSTNLQTDVDDFYTIKSKCDFFEPEDDNDPEDTWRENINSVNSVSLTIHIGQDPKKTDFSDDDPINGEYENPTVAQSIDGGIKAKIHKAEIQQRFIVGNVSQQEYFAHVAGRVDEISLETIQLGGVDSAGNDMLLAEGKYTGKILNLNSIDDSWLIKNPADVLIHLIDKEFSYSLNEKDSSSITSARQNHENWEFDFTISEETDPVEFLEDYCKNTMFCARMRYDGTFGYINLFKDVNESDKVINSSDIINFNITKTPKNKLFLKVRVSYDYDEGLDSYQKSTNLDGGGIVPGNLEEYMETYSVQNVENYYLDFKSRFIKNSDTAKKLRNQLLSYYKNRHNVFEVTLPHTYLDLECGDIVEFSDLVQGVQIFGLDYTENNTLNGQIVTKYFVVTELVKSSDSVQLKLLQQHFYDENFREEEATYDFLYNIQDTLITDTEDAEDAESTEEDDIILYEVGDVNYDSFVDVLDIVIMVNEIVSGSNLNIPNGDINQDGFFNILDLVQIIKRITNE